MMAPGEFSDLPIGHLILIRDGKLNDLNEEENMSRRRRVVKRTSEPDPIYRSHLLAKFINKIMMGGKKSTAQRITYSALEKFAKRIKTETPLEAFEKALDNAQPAVEVKSRRIGGATYQVPVEIPSNRRISMAMRWIITFARAKPGRAMDEALASELVDCYNHQGATIKKKEDTHKMAEANKAFAHFKW